MSKYNKHISGLIQSERGVKNTLVSSHSD